MDKNGACYIVFPDCPLVDFPNVNYPLGMVLIGFGKLISKIFDMKSVGLPTFTWFFIILLIMACCILVLLIPIAFIYVFIYRSLLY